MPAGGNVAKGDRFRAHLHDGREVTLVAVDKLPKNMKVTYWVNGTTHAEIARMAQDYVWRLDWGWECKDRHGRWAPGVEQHWTGRLALCEESQLDEEKNEFGIISP